MSNLVNTLLALLEYSLAELVTQVRIEMGRWVLQPWSLYFPRWLHCECTHGNVRSDREMQESDSYARDVRMLNFITSVMQQPFDLKESSPYSAFEEASIDITIRSYWKRNVAIVWGKIRVSFHLSVLSIVGSANTWQPPRLSSSFETCVWSVFRLNLGSVDLVRGML